MLTRRYRENMRGYHVTKMFDSLVGPYLEDSWWFESVGFAEKLALNGIAMFIAEPAAQITFGLLAAALLVCVNVGVKPFNEDGLGILANLLAVATFLLLLVGVHTELVGDDADAWTADVSAVRDAIVATVAMCFVLGVFVVVKDAVGQLMQARDAHKKAYDRQQARLGKPRQRKSSWLSTLRRKKRTPTGSRRRSSVLGGYQPPGMLRAEAAAGATWAVRVVAGIVESMSPLVEEALSHELRREFDGTLPETMSVESVIAANRNYVRRSGESAVDAPTGPAKEKALRCIAAGLEADASTLPELRVPLATVLEHALEPGMSRLSVLVGRPPSRIFLELTTSGLIAVPGGGKYTSPHALYLDKLAFGGKMMSLRGGSPGGSVWYHPSPGSTTDMVTLWSVAAGVAVSLRVAKQAALKHAKRHSEARSRSGSAANADAANILAGMGIADVAIAARPSVALAVVRPGKQSDTRGVSPVQPLPGTPTGSVVTPAPVVNPNPDNLPFVVRATLVDASNGESIPDGRVMLFAKKNGVVIQTGVSNSRGQCALVVRSVAQTMGELVGPQWRDEAAGLRAWSESRGLHGTADLLVTDGGSKGVVLMMQPPTPG